MRKRRSAAKETIIEVEGVFDVPAAKKIATAVAGARPGEAIRIDAGRVSHFHDFGLAILAQALGETSAARVALRGMRTHQLRILRYFGVDAARLRLRERPVELDIPAAAVTADAA